jgi:two-component system CheB/CheR fusion protein
MPDFSGSEVNRAIPIPFEENEPETAPFPVVGIGASAGGLEAFSQLFTTMPHDTGMAFVLIQHLDPAHKSLLSELLSKTTLMRVTEVVDGVSIEPNHVYVIPANASLRLAKGGLHLSPRSPSVAHFTIDEFFRSLAVEQGRLSIGVVLSGTGSDGSQGLKAIKSACGITFAQDEQTAHFPGMPRSAIATGIVDFVMPPARIGEELARISHHRYVVPPPNQAEQEILPDGDGELKEIFSTLLKATGVDFSHYKQNTIRRRIGRRMIVHRFERLREYLDFLRLHPEEKSELYRDVLINVTSFFRDPEVFAGLARSLSTLTQKKEIGNSFRVWVPGCSTGEELYSLAICVQEVFQTAGIDPSVQFFGTDISEGAIEIARSGVYPQRIAQEISEERLSRYFAKVDGKFQVIKAIRETCIFARHNLARDAPFPA